MWARPNKGVKGRAARDVELEAVSRPTLESARAALERKAKIYEKLKKGKSGGLSDAQYDALLVDVSALVGPAESATEIRSVQFDAKEGDSYESDTDDEDESLTVPAAPGQDVCFCLIVGRSASHVLSRWTGPSHRVRRRIRAGPQCAAL